MRDVKRPPVFLHNDAVCPGRAARGDKGGQNAGFHIQAEDRARGRVAGIHIAVGRDGDVVELLSLSGGEGGGFLAGYQIVLHYLVDRSLTARLGERAGADGGKRAAHGVHGEAQDVMQAVVRLREGQYLAVRACAHNAPLWNAAHEKGLRFRIVCYAFGNESLIRNLKGHFGVGDLGQFRFHRGAQSLEILVVPEPLITQERRRQKALAKLQRLSQAGERIVTGARSRLIGAKIKVKRRVVRPLPQEPLDRGDGALIGIFRALPRVDRKSIGDDNGSSERGAQPASHSVTRHQRYNTSHNLPPQFLNLPQRNDSRAGSLKRLSPKRNDQVFNKL